MTRTLDSIMEDFKKDLILFGAQDFLLVVKDPDDVESFKLYDNGDSTWHLGAVERIKDIIKRENVLEKFDDGVS